MIDTSDISDSELVRRALLDKNAFAVLIDRYAAPLSRYIVRLGCKDPHQVEDILQEVFIKIYRTLTTYDATSNFSAWAYRIAHNQTIDMFRKSVHQSLSIENESDLENIRSSTAEDVYTEIDTQLDQEYIRTAIAQLDQKYRDVIILRYLEDKSYDEIAAILRKPPGTIAILLRRAKEKLRTALKTKYQS